MTNSSKDHVAHDLFLLMLNLSQINEPERMKLVYLDALNQLFEQEIKFSHSEIKESWFELDQEIKTLHNSFGFIGMEFQSDVSSESKSLIYNSISMLAIVLENRQREHLLARRSEQLEATNRELESFSYSISHDLRAPIRSIDGFSQALLDDYGDSIDDEAKGFLQRIRSSTQRMSMLIDDLLRLAKITRGTLIKERVNLSEIAEGVVSHLQNENLDRTVNVSIEDNLLVYADRGLLEVALENLLGNAWKYTSKNECPTVELGKTTKAGKPVFFIRDNGVGFDINYKKDLFLPFRRLHKSSEFEGNGIGLATVDRIFHCHGGEIWANSEIGNGAEFFFSFPNSKI